MKKAPLLTAKYVPTYVFVTSLFLLWGIAITMGDLLNRRFQTVLNVSIADSGLVQFSIFGAYFVMGIPAGLFMKKYGYKNGVLLGLALYAIGAFMFYPAAEAQSFDFFRLALFVLACGLATLETVAHPFSAALGHEETSEQRINLSQTFNGVGAIIGPVVGSYIMLRNVPTGDVVADLAPVKYLYIVIGAVVAAVAISFSFIKVPPLTAEASGSDESASGTPQKGLFAHRHFIWAAIAQFFNVAAQGATWAFFINYAVKYIPDMTDEKAGYYFAFSMVLLLAGRAVGTFLMRFVKPNILLAIFAGANILMCLIISQTWGWASFIALMMLNFFMSIMFPTIFGLGLRNLGPLKPQASSYIVMGVVGGAVFPPIMGKVADIDVAQSYLMPIICYVVILLFGLVFSKPKN
ncbi:L-fucose:H+ symporter permease [Runella sp. MFBS21]|uniref:L-fucose:H+ symporter permease n=1 Tax=Runella sp. MFBS21 TaxID=3034018 RepID=UPI0023F72141|nr:L-fucose:H+ symporter permease [Runella sp. MFBS21]MDF7819650.1 L-fucose:H+ symporter permease [Runella sp. MFBS21]